VAADHELAERVRRQLAGRDDVVEKRMVGGLSWSAGGRMFCGVTGAALMVRVGAGDVALGAWLERGLATVADGR
jgi:hypothetical protein